MRAIRTTAAACWVLVLPPVLCAFEKPASPADGPGTRVKVTAADRAEVLRHFLVAVDRRERFQVSRGAWAVRWLGAGREAAAVLGCRLQDGEAAQRRMAAFALGELGRDAAGALPALERALSDEDEMVRAHAARCLAGLGEGARAAGKALRRAATDPSPVVRQRALFALATVRSERPNLLRPLLVKALSDQAPEVREAAAGGLAVLGPDAAPAWTELVAAAQKDPSQSVRQAAVRACGRLGSEGAGAVAGLLNLLDGAEADDSAAARVALKRIGRHDVPVLVERGLRSSSPERRRQAAEVVAALGPAARSAVPALSPLLEDSDPAVREAACEALGRLGPDSEPKIPRLIDRLADHSPGVRSAARTALEQLAPRSAVALGRALQDPRRGVKLLAAQALAKVGREARAAIPDLVRLLQDVAYDYDQDSDLPPPPPEFNQESLPKTLHASVHMALLKAGPEVILPLTDVVTSSANPRARAKALEILGQYGAEAAPAVPAVLSLLTTDARDEALACLVAISQNARQSLTALAGAKEADRIVALVAENLNSPREHKRYTAAMRLEGMESVDARKALPAIRQCLARRGSGWSSLVRALGKMAPHDSEARADLLAWTRADLLAVQQGAETSLQLAREALENIPLTMKDVPEVIGALARKNISAVGEASRLAARLGPAAIPALCRALEDRAASRGAAQALGFLGPRASEAVPALRKTLAACGDQHEFKEALIAALGDIGPAAQAAIPDLLPLLKEGAVPRVTVVRAVGKIGRQPEKVIPVLLQTLATTHEPRQVAELARALAAFGARGREAAPLFIARIREFAQPLPDAGAGDLFKVFRGQGETREAALMIAQIGMTIARQEACAQLIADLVRISPDAHRIAPLLIDLLLDEGHDAHDTGRAAIQRAAARALMHMRRGDHTPHSHGQRGELPWVGEDGLDLVTELPTHARTACGDAIAPEQQAAVLAWIGSPRGPAILGLLLDVAGPRGRPQGTSARSAVVAALVEVSGLTPWLQREVPLRSYEPLPEPSLRTLAAWVAAHGDEAQKVAAIRCLRRWGGAGDVRLLLTLARPGNATGLRAEAVYALAGPGAGDAAVLPVLCDALANSDGDRSAAVHALACARPCPVAEARHRLTAPEAAVREASAHLLGLIGASAGEARADLSKLLDDKNARVRRRAAWALGFVGRSSRASVPGLQKALLGDPDAATRAAIIYSLGRCGARPTDTITPLTRCLADPSADVRAAAAEVLSRFGAEGRSAREVLETCLGDPSREVRLWAFLTLLGQKGTTEQSVRWCNRALQDPSRQVREQAAAVLAQLAWYPGNGQRLSPRAVVALFEATRGENDAVTVEAITKLLIRLGPAAEPAVPSAIQRLASEHGWERKQAAELLGAVGPAASRAVPLLAAAVLKDETEVGHEAVLALARMGPPGKKAAPLIVAELERIQRTGRMPREERTQTLVWSLGLLGDGEPGAVGALRGALAFPRPRLRAEAALALGRLGRFARAAAGDLRQKFTDPEELGQAYAASAFWHITADAEAAVPVLRRLVTGKGDKTPRGLVLELLQEMGWKAQGAAGDVAGALADPDDKVRAAAARCLTAIGPTRAGAPVLLKLLRNDSRDVRLAAVGFLADLGPAAGQAIPDLLKLLHGDDAELLVEAAIALYEAGKTPKDLGDALARATRSGGTEVRLRLAWFLNAVGRTSPETALPLLRRLLEDPEEEVRLAAVLALPARGAPEAVLPLLAKGAADPKALVRSWAAEAVRKLPPQPRLPVPWLTGLLKDEDPRVRLHAAAALCERDGPRANAALAVLTELTQAQQTRWDALLTLRNLGPVAKPALPALTALLNKGNTGQDLDVAWAIWSIDPQAEPPVAVLLQLLAHAEKNVPLGAVELAGRMKANAAVPRLRKFLGSKEPWLRRAAAVALLRIDPRAEAPLPILLNELRDPAQTLLTVQILGELSQVRDKSLPALRTLLKSEDPRVRVGAAQAVGPTRWRKWAEF